MKEQNKILSSNIKEKLNTCKMSTSRHQNFCECIHATCRNKSTSASRKTWILL